MENKTYKEKKIEALRQLIETDNIIVEELFPVPVITPQKEEEYTILMFERVKNVGTYDRWWTLQDNGGYSESGDGVSGDGVCTLNIMMNIGCSVKDGSFRIYQIRRNSDSSIWTIGDKYASSQVPSLGIRTIEKFVIDDENIGIRAVEALSAELITTSLKYLTVPVPVNPTWVVESFICTVDNATKFNRCGGTYASTWTQEQMLGKTVAHGIARTVADGSLQIYSIRTTPDSPVIQIGDWITAECTHMGTTPMQIEGFVVNDKNNLLIKTRQFRTHGIGIENCKKVKEPLTDLPAVQPEQEQIAKVGEYVIAKDQHMSPDKAVIVTAVPDENDERYHYTYPDGKRNGCRAKWIRKATQEEIDCDWKKQKPEKVEELVQVLLTRKQINKLKEILK
jgi:hypothetical protein